MKARGPEIPSVYSLVEDLRKNKILPVYFICGEDHFAIQNVVKLIDKTVAPLITSEFDKDVFSAEKDLNLNDVLDAASAFPFGSEKKLVILKNIEKISDKKALTSFIKDPPDFAVLLLSNYGSIKDLKKEPFKTLLAKGFIFEAKELKGQQLIAWLTNRAKQLEMQISNENAHMLVDIVGEDRNLLEIQLQKIFNYLTDSKEITSSAIKEIASSTKEYSIFNLTDAVGKGQKAVALKIGYELIGSGFDMVRIINMLVKYITVTAQYMELRKEVGLNSFQASRKANVSNYFYLNCSNAKFLHNEKRLLNAVRALYEAEISLKTSSTDQKTILAVLLDRIMGEV